MALAAVAVTPVSVVFIIPVGLPVPSPLMNAFSSAAAIRLTNSFEIYPSMSKAASFKSSSDTFIIDESL